MRLLTAAAGCGSVKDVTQEIRWAPGSRDAELGRALDEGR